MIAITNYLLPTSSKFTNKVNANILFNILWQCGIFALQQTRIRVPFLWCRVHFSVGNRHEDSFGKLRGEVSGRTYPPRGGGRARFTAYGRLPTSHWRSQPFVIKKKKKKRKKEGKKKKKTTKKKRYPIWESARAFLSRESSIECLRFWLEPEKMSEDDFLRFSYRGLKGSVDLDVAKGRVIIRRFLAIWVPCVVGSVDLDVWKRGSRIDDFLRFGYGVSEALSKNRRFLAISRPIEEPNI